MESTDEKIIIKNYYDNIKWLDQSKLRYDFCQGCMRCQDDVVDDTGYCVDCMQKFMKKFTVSELLMMFFILFIFIELAYLIFKFIF